MSRQQKLESKKPQKASGVRLCGELLCKPISCTFSCKSYIILQQTNKTFTSFANYLFLPFPRQPDIFTGGAPLESRDLCSVCMQHIISSGLLTKIIFKLATNLHRHGPNAALSPGPINWIILPSLVILVWHQTRHSSRTLCTESVSQMVSQCLFDTWRTFWLLRAAQYEHVILNMIWKLDFFEAMNAWKFVFLLHVDPAIE